MFEFQNAEVPVRSDLSEAFRAQWIQLAAPGATLTSRERLAVATEARRAVGESEAALSSIDPTIVRLASTLMADPGDVDEAIVRSTADAVGDPTAVEVIGIISQLSAVDGFHHALGIDVEPLPDPIEGEPTGAITRDLKRRRTHVPMPPGPIPVSLDLTPSEGLAMEAIAGPLYMTYEEMAFGAFARNPGLNRAQMELISSKTSLNNTCFY